MWLQAAFAFEQEPKSFIFIAWYRDYFGI